MNIRYLAGLAVVVAIPFFVACGDDDDDNPGAGGAAAGSAGKGGSAGSGGSAGGATNPCAGICAKSAGLNCEKGTAACVTDCTGKVNQLSLFGEKCKPQGEAVVACLLSKAEADFECKDGIGSPKAATCAAQYQAVYACAGLGQAGAGGTGAGGAAAGAGGAAAGAGGAAAGAGGAAAGAGGVAAGAGGAAAGAGGARAGAGGA